jgi:phage-related minor tail protein
MTVHDEAITVQSEDHAEGTSEHELMLEEGPESEDDEVEDAEEDEVEDADDADAEESE